MTSSGSHSVFKVVSVVVIAAMLVAIAYAAYIAVTYWGGIGV
jgi:hypothetical protein